LTQALLGNEKYAEAIRLLEDPKVGPLSLLLDQHKIVMRPEYVVETYKAALRAYVSVSPPRIAKAIDTMKRLETAVAASGSGQPDQLLRIYVSLAKALNEQLERLRETERDDDVAQLTAAFGEFLDYVMQKEDGGSWTSRYWIAQAYYTMGESLPPEESKPYYSKARGTFEKLLADSASEPSSLPNPTAILAVQKQLAECHRALGDHRKALDLFSEVLADQESQLSVQQSAARTYQAWGVASGNVKQLERAIYGGYKLRSTGKNRIWGWLKLALVAERAARSNAGYQDAFFEARLEAARCRFLVGMESSGAERLKNFATAKQSIRSMLQLYPELGGSRWRGKFESLLRQIQKAAGDTPAGLREFAATQP
jgi:tetratricopeptide (TPR) repeat protein